MTPTPAQARSVLVLTGLAQLGHSFGLNAVRAYVLFGLIVAFPYHAPRSIMLVLAACTLPAMVVAPLAGALADRWSPTRALLVTAILEMLVFFACRWLDFPWLSGAGVLAMTSACHGAARSAIIAELARHDIRRIARFQPWAALASVAGLLLGAGTAWFAIAWGDGRTAEFMAMPTLGFLTAFACAVILTFAPSDTLPTTSRNRFLLGDFIAGCRAVFADRCARNALVGSALLTAFGVMATGLVFSELNDDFDPSNPGRTFDKDESKLFAPWDSRPWYVPTGTLLWLMGGAAVGVGVTFVQRHPFRVMSLVPAGATLGLTAAVWMGLPIFDRTIPAAIAGVGIGMAGVALRTGYRQSVSSERQGAASGLFTVVICATALTTTRLLLVADDFERLEHFTQWGMVLTAVAGLLLAVRAYNREATECFVEILLLPMYRIRGTGPGLPHFPHRGPALVIANHTAWFDPLWLAKIVPGPLTPLMTSRFFDLPVICFFMRHVMKAIRVPEKPYRREAPELKEAVAALDRGEIVVIFPEGYLRRKEETPMRRFGQGAWHILRDRPDTPIIAGWVEGGWGSFTSYFGGPPTKNKRIDKRRLIRVAVADAVKADPKVLADHHAARAWLMQLCLSVRPLLGLPPVSVAQLPEEKV
jgi:1-acyl-sn-glycerol-3-phosphate acyltransferase